MVELRLFELAHRAGPSINSAFFSPRTRHSMVNRSPRRAWKVNFFFPLLRAAFRKCVPRSHGYLKSRGKVFICLLLGGYLFLEIFSLVNILVGGIDIFVVVVWLWNMYNATL